MRKFIRTLYNSEKEQDYEMDSITWEGTLVLADVAADAALKTFLYPAIGPANYWDHIPV